VFLGGVVVGMFLKGDPFISCGTRFSEVVQSEEKK
jgi:hypothetical protein